MADATGISLEETNKIRISLGLKPLKDDKAPVADKEKEAENNYARVREQENKSRADKALRDKIAKVRNRQELNARLKGATLGDLGNDDGDTLSWVKRNKKVIKEMEKRKMNELEEMDKMFQGGYGEDDLSGLKVSHDLDELVEGEEQILTLKDSRILDNEEDELQNVLTAEHKRTEQRIQNKANNRQYTGYDDEEFTDGQAGMKKKVLAKYDEDIEGPQETGFRLGSSAKPIKAPTTKEQTGPATVNKDLLTIDYIKNVETSDYLQEGDIGFKKPKKKKKRANQRVVESEVAVDDQQMKQDDDQMQVDEISAPLKSLDTNFVDDDELQAALARSRKAKMKKMPKLTPEEIARRIAEEKEAEAMENMKMEQEEVGLVIDDTSEFVQSISLDAIEAKPSRRVITISTAQREASDDDDAMDEDEELEAGEVDPKQEEEMLALKMELDKHFAEDTQVKTEEAEFEVGTAAEKTHTTGLAGTLSILRATGALQETTTEQRERERLQRQRDQFLADQRAKAALRDLERVKARGGNKDQQQREYDNRLREQQEARQAVKSFENYKPDVNIVYHDEFGREMTPKEAWKALSHRFHGKGSGKAKTEKRLKKIAEEKKMQAMLSGETPLGMTSAFQARQEKLGQAHMVLSVGNRGAAPQLEQYLESPNLTKPKADGKKKKAKDTDRPSEQPALVDVTHFVAAAAPSMAEGETKPAMSKAKFAPVGSFVSQPTGGDSGNVTPVPGGRIALNLKRKADDEGSGTPPHKRR